ncbi:hypothetical protein CEXT_87681 [Caerostris extrusa]|uniref:Uncharacterized protein n=1 Tax=Caerostris extrusa TaxID=172846 RepID=A0AAV4Y434_CAEEX|nr:hypothetical protein CEXT_87681 [Caerostris extrusa]
MEKQCWYGMETHYLKWKCRSHYSKTIQYQHCSTISLHFVDAPIIVQTTCHNKQYICHFESGIRNVTGVSSISKSSKTKPCHTLYPGTPPLPQRNVYLFNNGKTFPPSLVLLQPKISYLLRQRDAQIYNLAFSLELLSVRP